jgi:hypothetical protein
MLGQEKNCTKKKRTYVTLLSFAALSCVISVFAVDIEGKAYMMQEDTERPPCIKQVGDGN